MDRVEDGSLQLTTDDFPSFLYVDGTIYDEDNEDTGLFQGLVLVRVRVVNLFNHCSWDVTFQAYRHIFTGPSSAINPNSEGPRKTKAKKFKLTEVTGRTIAYACVQVSDFKFLWVLF